MTTVDGMNLSGLTTPYPDADRFVNCNLSQPGPDESGADPAGIRLWPADDRPRIFEGCNLTNALPPPGSTLTDCNLTVLKRGVVVGTGSVVVDGNDPITVDQVVTRIYGRLDPETGQMAYFPAPKDIDEAI